MNNHDKLLKLRRTLALSQHDLALKIGVSEGAVNYFENNRYTKNCNSRARMKINAFIDNFNGIHDASPPPPRHDEHATSEKKTTFSFSKGKRYFIFDSGNGKGEADYIKPETGKGCIFVYLRKEGKHHIFREERGGWIRTYTDIQLIGKNIQEVT